MIHIIENHLAADKRPLLQSMFADRKRLFVDLFGWDVPVVDGQYEMDEFDTAGAVYLVIADAGGGHAASLRLVPTNRPHMIGTIFQHLCPAGIPAGDTIWESTRLCRPQRHGAECRRELRNQLISAMVDFALERGIDRYTGVLPDAFRKEVLAMGWRGEPLGPAVRMPGGPVGAFMVHIAAQARQDLPPTAQPVLEEIADGWSRGVSSFGLAPHDDTGLAAALNLARTLYQRAADAGALPTDFRTFSRAAGTDSKALERLSSPVARLFRRLYPEVETPIGLDADDLLATFGIVRTPQALTLSGPISIDGQRLPQLRFYGVPPEQGDMLSIAAPVDHVLTIENYTSFVRHVRELNEDKSALVIYTAGFPARAHLRQIVRLRIHRFRSDRTATLSALCPSFRWRSAPVSGAPVLRAADLLGVHRGRRRGFGLWRCVSGALNDLTED